MAGPPAVVLQTRSADGTRRLGATLGRLLRAGDVVLLEGDLGAGKTVLAQGIGEGLDVEGPVTSPTFVLIAEHAGRLPFYHADLYRLSGAADVAGTGLEELLGGEGVVAVEWPGRGEGLLPAEHLRVTIEPGATPEGRRIGLVASGPRHAALLAGLATALAGGPELP